MFNEQTNTWNYNPMLTKTEFDQKNMKAVILWNIITI